MWGKVASLPQVEANGDLRLSMQKRAFDAYFLYASDNTTQPSRFIGNKVSGILFENKIDHATYFGSNIEYIQGVSFQSPMFYRKSHRQEDTISSSLAYATIILVLRTYHRDITSYASETALLIPLHYTGVDSQLIHHVLI